MLELKLKIMSSIILCSTVPSHSYCFSFLDSTQSWTLMHFFFPLFPPNWSVPCSLHDPPLLQHYLTKWINQLELLSKDMETSWGVREWRTGGRNEKREKLRSIHVYRITIDSFTSLQWLVGMSHVSWASVNHTDRTPVLHAWHIILILVYTTPL